MATNGGANEASSISEAISTELPETMDLGEPPFASGSLPSSQPQTIATSEEDAEFEVDDELAGAPSMSEPNRAPELELSGVTLPKVAKNATPIWSALLAIPAACLEVVPELPENQGRDVPAYFVIGTYDLQKETPPPAEDSVQAEGSFAEKPETAPESTQPQVRRGSLMLWKWAGDHAILVKTVPHPCGVFDLKFYFDTTIFAVADTTGMVSIYQVSIQGIVLHSTHKFAPPDVMITALCWHTDTKDCHEKILAMTTSAGDVFLAKMDSVKELRLLNKKEPVLHHAFPVFMGGQSASAWNCAFAYLKGPARLGYRDRIHIQEHGPARYSPDIIMLLSGGEDARLRSIQCAVPGETQKITEQSSPGHDAGITAILPLPTEGIPGIILTGGYDDTVRIFSTSGSRFHELAQRNLGGGVWRLKLIDHQPSSSGKGHEYRVLASCMYDGCKILEVQGPVDAKNTWSIEILAELQEYESLNYASDVLPLGIRNLKEGEKRWGQKRLVISTSFYNRLLRVWEWDPLEKKATNEGGE